MKKTIMLTLLVMMLIVVSGCGKTIETETTLINKEPLTRYVYIGNFTQTSSYSPHIRIEENEVVSYRTRVLIRSLDDKQYLEVVLSHGTSMLPTIANNSLVILQQYNNQTLYVGDVIVYIKDGKYITHRIIEINNTSITTKGDTNGLIDKPINYTDVYGIVVGVLY